MKTKLLKRLRRQACEQIYILKSGEHNYDIMDNDIDDWWFDFSELVDTTNTLSKAVAIVEDLQRERVITLLDKYKSKRHNSVKAYRIDYYPWKMEK
jgi:hypothetical protein